MVLNLTPSTFPDPTAGLTRSFEEIPGVTTPPAIEALGPDLTDMQRSTNLATFATGGGAAGGGFAGEQLGSNTVNYMANILFNRIAPSGTPVEENVQRAFKPIELQYLRQLGLQGTTTSEIFAELGLGEVLEAGIPSQGGTPGETPGVTPVPSDLIRNNIVQALTVHDKGHGGGDRNVGGPQFGGSRLAPRGSSVTGEEVGAGAMIAGALSPMLGAAGGLGALGTGLTNSISELTGRPAVLGPTNPPINSEAFDDLVDLGKGPGDSASSSDSRIGTDPARDPNLGPSSRPPGGSAPAGSTIGTSPMDAQAASLAAARARVAARHAARGESAVGTGGSSAMDVAVAADLGGMPKGGIGGSTGGGGGHPGSQGSQDSSERDGPFHSGGLIKEGYAEGGQIGMGRRFNFNREYDDFIARLMARRNLRPERRLPPRFGASMPGSNLDLRDIRAPNFQPTTEIPGFDRIRPFAGGVPTRMNEMRGPDVINTGPRVNPNAGDRIIAGRIIADNSIRGNHGTGRGIADGNRMANRGDPMNKHDGGLVRTGYATGGMINNRDWHAPLGYATGGEIEGDPGMALADVLGGMGGGGDPSYTPRPEGAGPDDVSITAQQGEYVIAKPAIQALGVDFFNVLNDIFLKNPGLDPKAGLKAASAVIKVPEPETNVAQPGQNIGEQIGAAIPSPGGPFASGGLIGARPVSV